MDINANEVENKTEVNKSVELNESDINPNKEVVKHGVGDVESSHSESSKNVESREDRIKRLKEQSESERQRKLAEIMESQKLSNELRQKQQMERRKKIEELKSREEERRRGVEQRRRELDEKEKEKNETIQKRNKEREARAARHQQQQNAMRAPPQGMSSSMSQSMISPRQQTTARMTASVHSSNGAPGGASSCSGSSEKCMRKASYGRWPSSCDVDRVVVAVSNSLSSSSPAAGKPHSSSLLPSSSPSPTTTATAHKPQQQRSSSASNKPRLHRQLQPPEGFLEVDGHFIPASTRHAGCFLPYKGPQYRVRGVLAWGPPPASGAPHSSRDQRITTNEHGTAVSWWAGIDAGTIRHNRASSAHNPRGSAYPSVPCNMDTTGIDDDSTGPFSPRTIKDNIFAMKSGIENIKGKLANHKIVQSIPPIKMMKAFSQHHLSINVSSPHWNSGKDLTSPRSKNRSASRSNVTASVVSSLTGPSDSKPTTRKPKEEKLLFERLAKPRSGSQPPKMMLKEPGDTPSKIMVSSFNKQTVKSEKSKNKDKKLTTSVISLDPSNQKKEMIELPQTPNVDDIKDSDTTENTNNTTEDVSSTSKSGSRRGSKNLSKTPDVVESAAAPVVGEELAYKMKLAEQRRIAREKKEEQEQEKRRIEDEARQKLALEKKRVEEETRQMIEEEAKRVKLLEEEQLADLERQRLIEEAEKKKKEDTQRELEEKRLEELRLADEERMIRKRKLEMIMRRVKQPEGTNQSSYDENSGETVPIVMVDDKKQDSLMEISLQENILKPVDSSTRENSPQRTVAWNVDTNEEDKMKLTEENNNDDNMGNVNENVNLSRSNSPEMISDTVLNLTGPETINSGNSVSSCPISQSVNTTPAGDQPPKFKSKLLNSMLNQGRLNSNKPQDDKINSFVDGHKEKRNSLYLSPVVSDSCNTDVILPHSKSYDADLSHLVINGISHNQAINGLSSESEGDSNVTNGNAHHTHHNHQTDTYNAITLSNSTSNIDPPRLSLDKLELRSDSTCSQFSSEDCPPSMQPPHSQALELS